MVRPSRSGERRDPALEIEAINTKGSTENVPMLEAGKLDIGLVQGEVVLRSAERHRPGAGRPHASSRAMYSNSGMFVVRADTLTAASPT